VELPLPFSQAEDSTASIIENLYSPEKKLVAKILNYGTELTIKQREDNQYIVMPKYQCKLLQFLYGEINFSYFFTK